MEISFSFSKKKKRKLQPSSLSSSLQSEVAHVKTDGLVEVKAESLEVIGTSRLEVNKERGSDEHNEPLLKRAMKMKGKELPEEVSFKSSIYNDNPVEDFGVRILSKFGLKIAKDDEKDKEKESLLRRPEERSGLGFSDFDKRKTKPSQEKPNPILDSVKSKVLKKLVKLKSEKMSNRVGFVQDARQKDTDIILTIALQTKKEEAKFQLKNLPKIEAKLKDVEIFSESSDKFLLLKKRYRKLIKQATLEMNEVLKTEKRLLLEQELASLKK